MKITSEQLKQLVTEAVRKNLGENTFHFLLADEIDQLASKTAKVFVKELKIELPEDREEVMWEVKEYLKNIAKEWM